MSSRAINYTGGAIKSITGAYDAKYSLNCVRDTDAVIRYGGDEFLLVFRNIPLNILADRLESIRARIAGIDFSEFMDMNVTVSVGAAFDKGSTEKMIKEADAALYRAKSSKNQVIIDSVQRAV